MVKVAFHGNCDQPSSSNAHGMHAYKYHHNYNFINITSDPGTVELSHGKDTPLKH